MLNACGAFAACACSSAEVWIYACRCTHRVNVRTAGSLSIPSIPLKQTLPQFKVSVLAPHAASGPPPAPFSSSAARPPRMHSARAREANVCCSSCHNTDEHASAYTCRAHAPNDIPQWDARQDEVDHSERLRKLEEELRQMEADREKEVSSLQRESSKGVPPTSVLDSDDEEDALRSRARSLYVAPRNGVERGSRAGQGWGLTFSLSLPHLSPLSLSLSLSLARARSHTHTFARSLALRGAARLRAVRIICYEGDDA
jgi:hypothetical protein